MIQFFKKHFIQIFAGLALLAALVFYSLNLRHLNNENMFERGLLVAFSPAQRILSGANGVMGTVFGDYLSLVDSRKENARLRETVKKLNMRVTTGNEAILENERLKKLLELKSSLAIPSQAAYVIGEDSSPWFNTLLIDRGERDGLREGMPVVAVNGVVGQLIKVSPTTSRVLLLSDHASAMASVIERSRARGVVKGRGRNLCTMEFTEREDDVKVGDQVVTSGIGGIFPKGLPVGEVTMVRKGEFGIFQTINIRPAVDLTRVEELLVLKQQSDQ